MNDFDYWKILKWAVIVLLAGFVGQFGKSLAKYFMAKGKELRKEKGPDDAGQSILQIHNDSPADSPLAVNDNKSYPDLAVDAAKERAKQEKKALKTLEKQKKKEAKRLKKEGE